MTPERWSRVFELVDAAIGRHESQRASFLREACGGDEALRHDVMSLLDQRGKADAFLEPPAFERS